MENWIQLTWLNDFIFCPYSVYLHQIYHRTEQDVYHAKHQAKGKRLHDFVENNKESDSWNNAYVYSYQFQIYGKIDRYDPRQSKLIEYKSTAAILYRGYYYQIWAQYICMVEMGYPVSLLSIYDFKTDREQPLSIPSDTNILELSSHIDSIKHYDFLTPIKTNPNKCQKCIYNELCDQKKE